MKLNLLGFREPIRTKRSDKNNTNYFRKYCLFLESKPKNMCIKPWVDNFAWSMSQCCSSTCCTSTIVTCGHKLWVKQTALWSSFLHPATWRHWGELVTQSLHKLMLHAYLQVCGSWQQPCSSERKSGSRHCMYRFPWGEPQQVNTKNISIMRNEKSWQ